MTCWGVLRFLYRALRAPLGLRVKLAIVVTLARAAMLDLLGQ